MPAQLPRIAAFPDGELGGHPAGVLIAVGTGHSEPARAPVPFQAGILASARG